MQRRRLFFQLGFFALFLLAPALDWLRFDLNEAQLWFLGQRWSLGIDAFRAGEISANEAAMRIFLRAFLPATLQQVMPGPEAQALGVGLSSMGIYLMMAMVLLVRPRGLFAARG